MAESLNATFFAFRKREEGGGVLLQTTIAFALLTIAITGLFFWFNWQAIVDYMNWAMTLGQAAEKTDNPFAATMPPASVMALGPAYLLFMVAYYLLLASYEAACLRWMIRGERGGFFGLALNSDTLNVYLTYWVWWLLAIAFYIVALIVGVGLAFALGAGVQASPEQGGALGLGVFITILVVLLLLVYFGVRLAPAAATSIARKRFAFFDAWTVTRGRFFSLLGSFLLLFVIYIVAAMVLVGGLGAVMAGGLVGHIGASGEPSSAQELAAMFASPSVWIPIAILYGLSLAGGFVFYVALFGVNARAAQAALAEGKIAPAA